MEKPYATHRQTVIVPFSEAPVIAIGVLSALGCKHLFYDRNQHLLTGNLIGGEPLEQGGNTSTNFAFNIQWRKEDTVPDDLKQFAQDYPIGIPISFKVRIKETTHFKVYEEDAKKKVKAVLDELHKAGMNTTINLSSAESSTDHGAAKFAKLSDLAEKDYLAESLNEEGASSRLIAGHFEGKTVSVPKKFTEAHTLIYGPPGSGKSRGILIPNLILRPNTSAIVSEVTSGEHLKGPVFERTAGYREKHGSLVYYLNPSDLTSTRFNPVDFVDTISDAIYTAHLIVNSTTASSHRGEQIWQQSEIHLLTSLLLYAVGLRGKNNKSVEGGLSNLGHLRQLLRLGPVAVEQIIQSEGTPQARSRFSEFILNSSPNFRLGVFSGLIQRLNSWLDPSICKLTEVSDFDMDTLVNNCFTFYLAYANNRIDYKPIMALLLNMLISLPLRRKFSKPLTYLLDEFAAFGKIPGIDAITATIRNNEIGLAFAFQDLSLLEQVYPNNEAEFVFTATKTKIFFATASDKIQGRISRMLGRTTKEKLSISSSAQINRQTFGEPLMDNSAIANIPEQHALVISIPNSPFIAKTFDPALYDKYNELYPLDMSKRPRHEPDQELIDNCNAAKLPMVDAEVAEKYAKKYQELYVPMKQAHDNYVTVMADHNVSKSVLKPAYDKYQAAAKAFNDYFQQDPEQTDSMLKDIQNESSVVQNIQNGKPIDDDQKVTPKAKTKTESKSKKEPKETKPKKSNWEFENKSEETKPSEPTEEDDDYDMSFKW
ncbi:MAG: type IV secretory system conjugative DNA transfer family protein [Candidatus Obscuribacterales bacterium]|nr:type IV secretory system conjugative DNA transfer family protein [Candidatus Obscuribacterales bacterium]